MDIKFEILKLMFPRGFVLTDIGKDQKVNLKAYKINFVEFESDAEGKIKFRVDFDSKDFLECHPLNYSS